MTWIPTFANEVDAATSCCALRNASSKVFAGFVLETFEERVDVARKSDGVEFLATARTDEF